MALVRVRGQLRRLTGGHGDHEIEGSTVVELLRRTFDSAGEGEAPG